MAHAQPTSLPLNQVISQVENGTIKIPQFQRDFVWTKSDSAKLLDSMVKGYPIGTFIFWNTREQLRAVRNIGGLELPDTEPGQFSHQVLDGQQRLTSLYAAMKGAQVSRDGRTEDFATICIDLLADPATDDSVVLDEPPDGRAADTWIGLKELVESRLSVIAKYPEPSHEALQAYRDAIANYHFSIVTVSDAPIEVATEIFTRLNVGGTKLTTFEIMVAKTFDPDRGFDLAERYEALAADLADVGYGTVPSAVVLQTVGALQSRVIKAKDILGLDKAGFIETWPRAESAIKQSVDYFRDYFRIPVSKLLPYPHLIVPFAYFFATHPDPPLDQRKEFLEDFFWRVAMGTWYSRSTEARLEGDLRKIDRILEGERPHYEEGVDITPEAIADHGWFRAGRAWVKGILALYAAQQPESFANRALVRISNDWLKRANSKNYHHFFPKGWSKKTQWRDDWRINHVANITIVDDFLNKKQIGSKAPSDYLTVFRDANTELAQTMATHLIDINADGVFDDDFEQFFANRCRRISDQLKRRILPIDKDRHAKAPSEEEDDD